MLFDRKPTRGVPALAVGGFGKQGQSPFHIPHAIERPTARVIAVHLIPRGFAGSHSWLPLYRGGLPQHGQGTEVSGDTIHS
nr:hypothetical protein [Oxalobacteraceae bacterium]